MTTHAKTDPRVQINAAAAAEAQNLRVHLDRQGADSATSKIRRRVFWVQAVVPKSGLYTGNTSPCCRRSGPCVGVVSDARDSQLDGSMGNHRLNSKSGARNQV